VDFFKKNEIEDFCIILGLEYMGRKFQNRKKKQYYKFSEYEKEIEKAESEIYPQNIRQEKAEEVKKKLVEFQIENYREIKKLFLILDLWVKHNREHQELIDLPFYNNKKIEVRLYNQVSKESKIVIRHV
jgi:hypothetical protein